MYTQRRRPGCLTFLLVLFAIIGLYHLAGQDGFNITGRSEMDRCVDRVIREMPRGSYIGRDEALEACQYFYQAFSPQNWQRFVNGLGPRG